MIFISILSLIIAKSFPSLYLNLSSAYFIRISTIIFIYSGLLTLNSLNIQSIGSGIGIYSGLFQITLISQVIEIFLLILGFLILIAWPNINSNIKKLSIINKYSTDYSIIVLFSTLGSCLIISSSDLISMYLSIELQSFGLYILSSLYRDSERSTSAGLKYFLLGGLSSCIILFGSGIIYSYTGLTNFESIYSLFSIYEYNYIIQGLSLGLIFILLGLLFKIAAAPLHNWSPDVYSDTPTIVTIWLTIIPKISIIILILELYTQIGVIGNPSILLINSNGYIDFIYSKTIIEIFDLNIENITLNSLINNTTLNLNLINKLLVISSILSLIIGTVVGLAQIKIKRLLAYSTISHIGFMLLTLSINTEQSIDSLLFYIIQYSITNLNIFLILIAISYIFKKKQLLNKDNTMVDINYLSELKGFFLFNPLLSLSLAICLFSMAGIPPFIGFFSKLFVLYSAVQEGYYFISIVAILSSVVSASYYLKIIKIMYTSPENEDINYTKIIEEKRSDINIKSENQNNLTSELEIIQSNFLTDTSLIEEEIQNTELTNFHSYLISLLTLFILLFILKPNLILNSTLLLSLSIFSV